LVFKITVHWTIYFDLDIKGIGFFITAKGEFTEETYRVVENQGESGKKFLILKKNKKP